MDRPLCEDLKGGSCWVGEKGSPPVFFFPFPVRKVLPSAVQAQNCACGYLGNEAKGHRLRPLV